MCKILNRNLLATASQDNLIRVYNISQKDGGAPIIFRGHTLKPFNVEWSPILYNYLATGSDDRTVRVWNIQNVNESKELIGHTHNVRGILWNTEIPWLLLTGSWDSTIRLWDIRSQICIFVCKDHIADVYGITSHEDRPFVYVTCSRDTSIRFWWMEGIFQKIFMKLLINDDNWEDSIDKIDSMPDKNAVEKLYGNGSKKLRKELKEIKNEEDMVFFYEKVMKFFKVTDKKSKKLSFLVLVQ